MGRFARRIRKNSDMDRGIFDIVSALDKELSPDEITVSYGWSDELKDYVQQMNRLQNQSCFDLRDYTYETRPAMLSSMTKEAFESIKKTCPYFYEDEEGEVHFLSEWSSD